MKRNRTDDEYIDDDTGKRSTSVNFTMMACRKEEIIFFFYFFFFLLFFFQSCYKGYSLHDYKLKNTHECTAHMLTSKPMYKENKCIEVASLGVDLVLNQTLCVCVCVHAPQDLKLAIKQPLELLVPSSFRSFGIQNFIACSLFLVSLLLCLCYY